MRSRREGKPEATEIPSLGDDRQPDLLLRVLHLPLQVRAAVADHASCRAVTRCSKDRILFNLVDGVIRIAHLPRLPVRHLALEGHPSRLRVPRRGAQSGLQLRIGQAGDGRERAELRHIPPALRHQFSAGGDGHFDGGLHADSASTASAPKFIVRIALLPVITGLSYELIRFAAKRRGSLLALLDRARPLAPADHHPTAQPMTDGRRHPRARRRHGTGKEAGRRTGDRLAALTRDSSLEYAKKLDAVSKTRLRRSSTTQHQMADPAVITDPETYRKTAKAHSDTGGDRQSSTASARRRRRQL